MSGSRHRGPPITPAAAFVTDHIPQALRNTNHSRFFPRLALAADLLTRQVSVSDLVHHHQSRKDRQREDGPPRRPLDGGLIPVGEHRRHDCQRGQQVDQQAARAVIELQPGRGRGETQQLRVDRADAARGLKRRGGQGADTEAAVPGGQVATLGHVLAGHDEAEARRRNEQDQRLTEPVQAYFPLAGLEAEEGQFG